MEQKMKNQKYMQKIKKGILYLLFLIFTINCGGQGGGTSMVPWMAALMGGASPGKQSISSTDSNGVKLPEVVETPLQEVPTSGPTTILGKIQATSCTSEGLPIICSEDTGLNITQIKIQLISATNETIAITYPDSNGQFSFAIPKFKNGNYRVLINTEKGLNYSHIDFNHTFDPTKLSGNTIELETLVAQRYYLQKGPALISGMVVTSGFKDQLGATVVPQGALSGVKVAIYSSTHEIIAEQITNTSGQFTFSVLELPNGNYTIHVFGSEKVLENRPFLDQVSDERFIFLGNDPSMATTLDLRPISLQWQPSLKAPIQLIDWSISNAANPGMDLSGFLVSLKNSEGDSYSTYTDANGKFSFQSILTKGVYELTISKNGFLDSTSSFHFIPHHSGGATPVTQNLSLIVVPNPSNIEGLVSGPNNSPPRIQGATINFRPAKSHAPSSLAYLLKDDRLKNLAELWIRESCSNNPNCSSLCSGTGYSSACALQNQGSGPWNYTTYQNKVYEVKSDNTKVYFTAVAGKWEYYISASGYKNTPTAEITLNGNDVSFSNFILQESVFRSTIEGQSIITDTLINGTKNSYGGSLPGFTANPGIPGIIVVLLGNNDNSQNPVAHVTTTGNNGSFKFDGSSKVVSLPNLATLCGQSSLVSSVLGISTILSDSTTPTCSSVADSLRVAYTLANYPTASVLSNSPSVAGTDLARDSIHISNDTFRFKQGSYSLLILDPLKHLSVASTRAEISESSVNLSGVLSVVAQVPHLPRKTISGTLTDVISTANIAGATVSLGFDSNPDPNQIEFSPTAYRDLDLLPYAKPRIHPETGERTDILVPDTTTSADGSYSIPNVNPGNYLLKFSKSGYETVLMPITVSSSGTGAVGNAQTIQPGARGNLSGRVVIAGGEVFRESYNLELIHPNSGLRPTSPIQPSSLTSGVTNFSNAPTYRIFDVNSGLWKLKFSSPGYVDVEGLVTIQSGIVTNFDIITMIPGSQPPATISGSLFNAFNNQKITSGVTLTLRPGINTKSGPNAWNSNHQSIPPFTSADDGSYAIPSVPPGNYTLEVSGANYASTYQTVISAGNASGNQNIYVSPKLFDDEVRVVLTWNARPRDLDSHLEYGNSSCTDVGKKCQVVYNDKRKLNGDLTLDVDVVNGYGPETITLKNSVWLKPRRGYSVYKWSSESDYSIGNSGATVKVFKSMGLVKTYNAGSELSNRWWQVFCFDSSSNIIDIGKSGCEIDSFFNSPSN
jgi:hypothetical protein